MNFEQGKLRRKKNYDGIVDAIFERTFNAVVPFRGRIEHSKPLGGHAERA